MKINAQINVPDEYVDDFVNGDLELGKAVARDTSSGKVKTQFDILEGENSDDTSYDWTGVAIVVVGVIYGVNKLVHWNSSRKLKKAAEEFNVVFEKYENEIKEDILNAETIMGLLEKLDTIESIKGNNASDLFSTEQFRVMLLQILEFTKAKAAEQGSYNEEIERLEMEEYDNIVTFRECLELQKEIAERVA